MAKKRVAFQDVHSLTYSLILLVAVEYKQYIYYLFLSCDASQCTAPTCGRSRGRSLSAGSWQKGASRRIGVTRRGMLERLEQEQYHVVHTESEGLAHFACQGSGWGVGTIFWPFDAMARLVVRRDSAYLPNLVGSWSEQMFLFLVGQSFVVLLA